MHVAPGPSEILSAQDRSLNASAEWRRQIQVVDQQILSSLREQIEGGFDEAAYGDRMGFASLKRCALQGRLLV